MLPLDIVIMAAGKGTRMKSRIPKVLHTLGGKPLLGHVIDTALSLRVRKIVLITGHEAEEVAAKGLQIFKEALQAFKDSSKNSKGAAPSTEFVCVLQSPQLGTGHAVQQALPQLLEDGLTMVLSGDVPLTSLQTLESLEQLAWSNALALLTLTTPTPFGYGRVIRERTNDGKISPLDLTAHHDLNDSKNVDHTGKILGIVEEKDASEQQKRIREVYTGVLVAPTRLLSAWVNTLSNQNAQGEYYLTDVVSKAVAEQVAVNALSIDNPLEVMGVNSPAQLAELERAYQLRLANNLMSSGVRLKDPSRLDIRGELSAAQDVQIDVNCVFEGRVELEQFVEIGANCFIKNALIKSQAVIEANSHIQGQSADAPVVIGRASRVGPFARLRPGAVLGDEVHIGNFVEVKNSVLGAGTKANHLAYVGDALLGERVNFGAGSITANYDGANKHKTVIEDDVHVGSNSVLVAPLCVGAGGTVGAGSTLTKDTPPGALSITRAKQVSIENWKRPVKKAK